VGGLLLISYRATCPSVVCALHVFLTKSHGLKPWGGTSCDHSDLARVTARGLTKNLLAEIRDSSTEMMRLERVRSGRRNEPWACYVPVSKRGDRDRSTTLSPPTSSSPAEVEYRKQGSRN
jgi:hypothetical protein